MDAPGSVAELLDRMDSLLAPFEERSDHAAYGAMPRPYAHSNAMNSAMVLRRRQKPTFKRAMS